MNNFHLPKETIIERLEKCKGVEETAAYVYFGVDTKQQVEIKIQKDDPRVLGITQ
jgi:hypothetical protein